jgi:hypothetical protein
MLNQANYDCFVLQVVIYLFYSERCFSPKSPFDSHAHNNDSKEIAQR